MAPLRTKDYAAWNDFCAASDEAWFWHTSHWLDYTLAYRPEWSPKSVSFFCSVGGRIVAICPLIIETQRTAEGEIAQFSYGGDAIAAPAYANDLSPRQTKSLMTAVMAHVDALAAENQVKRVCFRSSPVAPCFWKSSQPRLNPLLRMGYLDVSLATQVLDLSPDEDTLLRRMRKGHRAAVKQAEKVLSAQVLDAGTITEEAFERYRLLHQKAAGRITRPLGTFRMMHEWIRRSEAVLTAGSLDGKAVGFALISVYKDGAYYSSGCEDPEYNHLPIGHLLQWRTMQWLRGHGVMQYEIGIQHFASVPHAPVSEKELNISLFKRGFGGTTVPFWRSEKFYDGEYGRRVLIERANRYVATTLDRQETDEPSVEDNE